MDCTTCKRYNSLRVKEFAAGGANCEDRSDDSRRWRMSNLKSVPPSAIVPYEIPYQAKPGSPACPKFKATKTKIVLKIIG